MDMDKGLQFMALYSWTSFSGSDSLFEAFSASLLEVGLEIMEDASNDQQLYAVEPANKSLNQSSRVNVIVFWACSDKSKYQIEVRSSEPMFKTNTRCENLAKELKNILPPCS